MENELDQNKINKRRNPNKKSILCVETGVVYESSYDASEKYLFLGKDIDPGNIRAVARGVTKTAGGLHWKYID